MVDTARAIVESYSEPVTLRHLFYRLVAGGSIGILRGTASVAVGVRAAQKRTV